MRIHTVNTAKVLMLEIIN